MLILIKIVLPNLTYSFHRYSIIYYFFLVNILTIFVIYIRQILEIYLTYAVPSLFEIVQIK